MKNRHFGRECSCILAGKARKCGRFWVFARVPNPGKQSTWKTVSSKCQETKHEKTAKSSRFTHVHRPYLEAMIDYRAPSCISTTTPLRILLGHLSMLIPGFSVSMVWGPDLRVKHVWAELDRKRAEYCFESTVSEERTH